jgi:hypothetical protein
MKSTTIISAAVAAAMMIVLSPRPAAAQAPNLMTGGQSKGMTPEEKEKRAAQEKAYEDQLKNIPDQKPGDPWGAVRGTEGLPAKKKQTGSK